MSPPPNSTVCFLFKLQQGDGWDPPIFLFKLTTKECKRGGAFLMKPSFIYFLPLQKGRANEDETNEEKNTQSFKII